MKAGIAGKEHMLDIRKRETVSSFAVKPGLVLAYTLLPAAKTQLTVLNLKKQIRRNDFKISKVVMAMFAGEDINLLFQLKTRFINDFIDVNKLKQIKTKEKFIDFFT